MRGENSEGWSSVTAPAATSSRAEREALDLWTGVFLECGIGNVCKGGHHARLRVMHRAGKEGSFCTRSLLVSPLPSATSPGQLGSPWLFYPVVRCCRGPWGCHMPPPWQGPSSTPSRAGLACVVWGSWDPGFGQTVSPWGGRARCNRADGAFLDFRDKEDFEKVWKCTWPFCLFRFQVLEICCSTRADSQWDHTIHLKMCQGVDFMLCSYHKK